MKQVDTLIVGGGISGLACGRQLFQSGADFLLVTDRLGGRVYTADDGLNFGAAYITSDYRHLRQFADRGQRIALKDIFFYDGRRYTNVFSRTGVRRLRGLARLYRLIFDVRKHLNALRRKAPHQCQKELLAQDPVLERYVRQPAVELVREHGLSVVNEIFCAPVLRSTLFVKWHETNAFYYIANTFPALLPTYIADLSRTADRLTRGWTDRIVRAKATAIEELSPQTGFAVAAGDREYRASRLVLAIPGRNSKSLIEVEHTARDVACSTIHIRGTRRKTYVPSKCVFFRDEHPITVLWPQHNGLDIAFSWELEPDLSEYYSDYEIIRGVSWKTAAQLSADTWRPLRPKPNLFTIGDHNVFGMEDAYLTGLFAANTIVSDRRHGSSP